MVAKKTKKKSISTEKQVQQPLQAAQKPVIGIKLAVLRSIMDELDDNPQLQKVFGKPVCEKIGIMAIGNDIKFMELPSVKLSPEDKATYLTVMNDTLRKRFARK